MRNTRIPLMLNAGITQINIDDALGLRTRHSALLHIESALPLHYTTLMGDAVLCCSSRNTCRVLISGVFSGAGEGAGWGSSAGIGSVGGVSSGAAR